MTHATTRQSLATTLALFLLLLTAATQAAFAQGTAFTYQGRLTDGGAAANGAYDLQFALFDAASAGTQQGANLTLSSVQVTGGVFTVGLDFGVNAFPGAPRFLQISVRPGASSGAFTLLTPRQPVTATPYALRSLTATAADSLSANCAGCVSDPQITALAGSKVTGTIPVAALPAGSANYIQNTTTPQSASNFNISGNGTAGGTLSGNVVNAATQFNLGGNRALAVSGAGLFPNSNTFAGVGAGANTTPDAIGFGNSNSFFGSQAGTANTTGGGNAFFGTQAGQSNTTGNSNAFFGTVAGFSNTTGNSNAFVGSGAGQSNTTGSNNAFVGLGAGLFNTTGNSNAFVGYQAGVVNTTGSNNAFVGYQAGGTNTTGGANAFFGFQAGGTNTTGFNNAFVGTFAGGSNTTGAFNTFIGRQAGANVTTGSGNVFLGNDTGLNNLTGSSNTLIGSGANVGDNGASFATAIGAGAVASFSNSIVLGRNDGSDRVRVPGGFIANVALNDSLLLLRGGADLSQRINYDFTINGLAFGAPGGFRWLNTTGGTSQEQMRLDSSGLNVSGDITLNDRALRLRGVSDNNHAIFYSANINGIEFKAYDKFLWRRGSSDTVQMTLDSNGVLGTRGGFHGKCLSNYLGDSNIICNQDLAETFRTKEQTEAGDVVTLIPQDHERPTVRKSLRAYDEHLVGVVSTNPGLVFDEGETKLAGANDHYITKDKTVVAAIGRVPVKFSLENGAINVGDPLTSSATEPGKAMKATGAGKIIGIALESSAKAKDGKLLLWLQVGHYAPPQQLDELRAIRAENAELTARNAAIEAQLQQQQTRTAAIEAQLSALLTQLAQGEKKDQEKK